MARRGGRERYAGFDPALASSEQTVEPPPEEPREQREAREQFDAQNRVQQLHDVLADERVRDFLWRFIEWTGMFAENFHPNFGVAAHQLGRAAAGRWMWAAIEEASPEALMQMLQRSRELKSAASREAQRPALQSED